MEQSTSSKSVRLQIQTLRKSNPQEFQMQDHCVLFFPMEVRYSLSETKNVVEDVTKVELMTTVTVRDGSRRHKATLMHIGSLQDCKEELQDLENKISSSKLKKEKSKSIAQQDVHVIESTAQYDFEKESEKVQRLSASTVNQESADASAHHYEEGLREYIMSNELWKKEVSEKLDRILEILNSGERRKRAPSPAESTLSLTPPEKKKSKLHMSGSDEGKSKGLQESPSGVELMYKDVNLMSLSSGGDVKKFALKVFKALFQEAEMMNGMIGPMERAKTKGKILLDESRVELLKRAIQEKFGASTLTKKWSLIRQSCNQKCLDTRKKRLSKEITSTAEHAPAGGNEDNNIKSDQKMNDD